jgi:chromosomal replication initiation ATPase DnaA
MNMPTTSETISYFDDLLNQHRIHQHINEYCLHHPINKKELIGRSRKAEYVQARHEIAQILKDNGYGPSEIGRALHRDHSTIIHYLEDRTPIQN